MRCQDQGSFIRFMCAKPVQKLYLTYRTVREVSGIEVACGELSENGPQRLIYLNIQVIY